jgi:EmrB/QacA subfamily drug resistance transporter
VSTAIRYDSRAGRGVLFATVLASGMALLDGTVVNVALRTMGHELDASLAELQWITNGYMLALASFILLGGSLGDRFGRRRVFEIGIVWFAVASLLCGLAQNPEQLIAARVLQGLGAALLTPGSLAIIQAVFQQKDRGRAIGAWAGLGGIAAAVGPFLGGWLVEHASWRWIFLLNLPVAVLTLVASRVSVPETRDVHATGHFDVAGSVLAALALAGVTFALIEAGSLDTTLVVGSAVLGVVTGVSFVVLETRRAQPMMPPGLFRSRQFSAANAMTLLVYAALGAMLFFVVLQLQTVSGWGPLAAGLSALPITVVMLLLSARAGALSQRIGPRMPMSVGPVVCALGVWMLRPLDESTSYWWDVLPGMTVFALGLTLLVAPLTATVLAAAPERHAGIASGINNAVARAGSLLAVAALPAAVGLSGADYDDPSQFGAGYVDAMTICAVLLTAGGLVSYWLIRKPQAPVRPAGVSARSAAGD